MPRADQARQRIQRTKTAPNKGRLLSLKAILQVPDALAELVEQAGGAKSRCAGFHAWFMLEKNAATSKQPIDAEQLSGGTRAQNIPHRPAYPAEFAGYISLDSTGGKLVGPSLNTEPLFMELGRAVYIFQAIEARI